MSETKKHRPYNREPGATAIHVTFNRDSTLRRRTWSERLFSWPWQPWKPFALIFEDEEPKQG